jgi:hypothetical protein
MSRGDGQAFVDALRAAAARPGPLREVEAKLMNAARNSQGCGGDGFVAELLAAAEGFGSCQREIEAVLRRWSGRRVYVPKEQGRQVVTATDLASHLVQGGATRSEAVDILRHRRGLSARHARRLVRAAVDTRGQEMAALAGTMLTTING